MNLTSVLKRPVITEKSVQNAGESVFTFEVSPRANKHQIKAAIERFYHVDVVQVRTTMNAGKRSRVGKYRRRKVDSPIKKALVQLKPGQKIDLFELEEAT